MPRLFIAIDFPDTVIDQLIELCDWSFENASWTDDDQFHLTLRFIGEADGISFADIRKDLFQIRQPAFPLTLKGIGFFPPRKQPRVLWAGVEKNDALYQLQKKIDTRLDRLHMTSDKRKFHPHVTLAKLRHLSVERIGSYLRENNLFKTEPFYVREFFLYSSVLTPRRAIHTQEASYPLISQK